MTANLPEEMTEFKDWNSYLADHASDPDKRKYDDPAAVAIEKTRELIFSGRGYGAVPTVKGVRSFSAGELKDLWD